MNKYREKFERFWDKHSSDSTIDTHFRRSYPDKSDKSFIKWLCNEATVLDQMLTQSDIYIDGLKSKLEQAEKDRDTIFKEELEKKIHQTSLKKISETEFYDSYLAYEAMKWLIQYLKNSK